MTAVASPNPNQTYSLFQRAQKVYSTGTKLPIVWGGTEKAVKICFKTDAATEKACIQENMPLGVIAFKHPVSKKICTLSIPSKNLAGHVFDTSATLEGQPPLSLHTIYDKKVDALELRLVDEKFITNPVTHSFEDTIMFDAVDGKIALIEVVCVTSILQLDLPLTNSHSPK